MRYRIAGSRAAGMPACPYWRSCCADTASAGPATKCSRAPRSNGTACDRSIRYAEDEIFTAQYCAHITHLVSNSNPTYHYRYVPTSLLRGKIDPMMLMRIRRYIHEQYKSLGYCDEILYLTTRTQFSRLRRELRRTKGWNAELANELAQGILDNWKFYRAYVRSEFRKGFYDTKALWIARLSCMINSRLWVKLVIKGLHI